MDIIIPIPSNVVSLAVSKFHSLVVLIFIGPVLEAFANLLVTRSLGRGKPHQLIFRLCFKTKLKLAKLSIAVAVVGGTIGFPFDLAFTGITVFEKVDATVVSISKRIGDGAPFISQSTLLGSSYTGTALSRCMSTNTEKREERTIFNAADAGVEDFGGVPVISDKIACSDEVEMELIPKREKSDINLRCKGVELDFGVEVSGSFVKSGTKFMRKCSQRNYIGREILFGSQSGAGAAYLKRKDHIDIFKWPKGGKAQKVAELSASSGVVSIEDIAVGYVGIVVAGLNIPVSRAAGVLLYSRTLNNKTRFSSVETDIGFAPDLTKVSLEQRKGFIDGEQKNVTKVRPMLLIVYGGLLAATLIFFTGICLLKKRTQFPNAKPYNAEWLVMNLLHEKYKGFEKCNEDEVIRAKLDISDLPGHNHLSISKSNEENWTPSGDVLRDAVPGDG